jgi:hypothetical protein
MFIDIHVHMRVHRGPLREDGQAPHATPEQLIERFDAIGIEAAVILPGVSPEGDWETQGMGEVLEVCRQWPQRFIPFCNVDPRQLSISPRTPLDPFLEHYKERGCRGLGEITANLPFDDPLVQNLFDGCQRLDLPVTFHVAPHIGGCYGLYDEPGLPRLERMLRSYPDLRFLGHSQAFWAEMAPLEKPADRLGYPQYPVRTEGVLPKLFRQYPNLLGDLSAGSGYNALARDEEYAARFCEEFQDRLFFGTDICAPDTEVLLDGLLKKLRDDGAISETAFGKIARENAAKLLGLS